VNAARLEQRGQIAGVEEANTGAPRPTVAGGTVAFDWFRRTGADAG
jgi:hypothetical protein